MHVIWCHGQTIFVLFNQSIIIIDSESLLLDVLAIALNQEGYKVIVIVNYQAALKWVRQHNLKW